MINKLNYRDSELTTRTVRLIGSEEMHYCWSVQVDENGCIEVAATVFGAEKSDQIINLDPEEAIAVANAMILAANEEIRKLAF